MSPIADWLLNEAIVFVPGVLLVLVCRQVWRALAAAGRLIDNILAEQAARDTSTGEETP
ncbi:hypothetical protein [Streptomyces sp. NPDC096324]|uniref:hypothetical protein n=1 Tax=Streptomyces sp. NPDC096324 TaxID=3366085 RepID=UPI0037FA570B